MQDEAFTAMACVAKICIELISDICITARTQESTNGRVLLFLVCRSIRLFLRLGSPSPPPPPSPSCLHYTKQHNMHDSASRELPLLPPAFPSSSLLDFSLQSEEFNMGSLMFPLFGLLLASIWYFRVFYRQYFNAMATLILVGITLLFIVGGVAIYRPPERQQQHQD